MGGFLLNAGSVALTVLAALFLFGLTVFVHEFGHFIVARRCGLIVKTFSIGFGHALVRWERNGIVYKIGWIPFGGYVSLPQLDPEGMERIQGDSPASAYPEISPWKKIAVAVSGPLGNVVLAAVLAVAVWLFPGSDAGTPVRPVIGSIETNSAAFASGLRQGDEITEVNGMPVKSWYDLAVEAMLKDRDDARLVIRREGEIIGLTVPVDLIEGGVRGIEGILPARPCLFGAVTPGSPADRAGVQRGDIAMEYNRTPILDWDQFTALVQASPAGTPATLCVERDGRPVSLQLIPEYNEEYKRMMIGVQLGGSGLPWMLYKNPLDQLKSDALAIVRVLKALVTPAEAKQAAGGLGGPIMILDLLMLSIRMGVVNTLGLIRFLNVNLAVLNLLPIPVLDGGHTLFALWHGITRRKVNVNVQTALVNLFAILLIGSMLLLSLKDIDRKFEIRGLFSRMLSPPAVQQDGDPSGEPGAE